MVASTYSRGLQLSVVYEGGKVDDPHDPGGRTNQGVTQRTYDAWRKSQGLSSRDVYVMADAERDAIYRVGYADPIRYDDLPAGVDYATFDFAINSGVSRAVKGLQAVVGTGTDGIVGPHTLAAVREAANHDEEKLIADLCAHRMAFLRSLSTFGRYGKGWTRRVEGKRDGFQPGDVGVVDYATMMARGDTAYGGLPSAPAGGKAWPEDITPDDLRSQLVAIAGDVTKLADRFAA